MKFLVSFLLFTTTIFALPLRPVPWVTEGAIAFLEDFVKKNPNARVLEFGSGASTVWFASRVGELYSVEHNTQWYEFIKDTIEKRGIDKGVHLILKSRPYFNVTRDLKKESFDLILVDGRNRKGCIAHSIRLLKPGGVLMLDNSERPYYFSVFPLMEKWPSYADVQVAPDSCGFTYKGWETRWWIKPL